MSAKLDPFFMRNRFEEGVVGGGGGGLPLIIKSGLLSLRFPDELVGCLDADLLGVGTIAPIPILVILRSRVVAWARVRFDAIACVLYLNAGDRDLSRRPLFRGVLRIDVASLRNKNGFWGLNDEMDWHGAVSGWEHVRLV